MSKLVIAFACVALIQIAAALNCYDCDKETCAKDKSAWTNQKCGNTAAPYENVCLTQVYKDTKDQKEYTLRKCDLRNTKEEFKCANLGTEVSCKVCTSDLCNNNSASAVSLSFAAISGVILALVAPKFYL